MTQQYYSLVILPEVLKKIYLFLFYVYVLLACISICVPCACLVLTKSKRGFRYHRTDVMDSYEPLGF